MEDDEERKASSEDVTDSGDESRSEPDAELMVTTRAKRTTAGNRYSTLVAQEEIAEDVEDDVALLFAEGDEEDEEYNSDEGADEVDMSSSDDDDQGPSAGVEDLEGEKEIEKEAKAERAKKRKADMALTNVAGLKKKPKLDPTSLRRAAGPKPSKRKERVSWLPEQGSNSARPSLRAQTILHRAETHAKLKVDEAQRLKMKAIREKREREREADAPKQLTQADRLAEAERIERKNAKSLNRWEMMEKKRAEEQAAKLAALKDRQLNGAVVTWYSSSHKYIGLKDDREIHGDVVMEGKKRGRKSKAFHEQMAAARLAESSAPVVSHAQPLLSLPKQADGTSPAITPGLEVPPGSEPVSITFTAPQGPNDFFLTGIHEYASMDADKAGTAPATSKDINSMSGVRDASSTNMAETTHLPPASQLVPMEATTSVDDQSKPVLASPSALTLSGTDVGMTGVQVVPSDAATTQAPNFDSALPTEQGTIETSLGNSNPSPSDSHEITIDTGASGTFSESAASPAISKPLIEVISTRNLVILDRFDDLFGQSRHDFGLFYNNRKTAKPVKQTPEMCLITGLPARYRDPATGIGYANAVAYKQLQQIKQYQFNWSSMLGCYVGRSTFVARGVPEGFLGS